MAPVRSSRNQWLLVSMAIALLVGLFMLARHQGEKDGQAARERLELVWANFHELPSSDQAILGGLAQTCELEDRPAAANETIACLREAAASEHPTLPKGVKPANAAGRLDALLVVSSARDRL